MKALIRAFSLPLAWIAFAAPAFAQARHFEHIEKPDRKSALESEPGVVYFNDERKHPVDLSVIKDAPVYSDKEGKQRLGYLKADQTVRLEAMTDRAYFVRGQGVKDGIAGWVPPWAFTSRDPNFVANLKKLYDRQLVVQRLISVHHVAVGMTPSEVSGSIGKPTKTTLRKTNTGESGRWEFIDYEEVKNYATVRDPYTGNYYQQLVSVTQVEKGKTTVDFENGFVSAIEESENRHAHQEAKLIVPPLIVVP